jgi:hypothetical protein
MGVGGQLDRVMELNGSRWLIDIKTGENLYDEYELQLIAYKLMWEEQFPQYPIDKIGVLHLNAKTRTDGRGDAIQGRGWKLDEITEDFKYLEKVWFNTLELWRWKNKNWKPSFMVLPDHFCKKEIYEIRDERREGGVMLNQRV